MKLALFEQFIEEFTYVDEELNPEERQQILQARLTNGKYLGIICLKFVAGFSRDSILSAEIYILAITLRLFNLSFVPPA